MRDALWAEEKKYQREQRHWQQLRRETLVMVGCIFAGACATSIGMVMAAITSTWGPP